MTQRSQWASRLGFILAASGSSIGLGNIWKFPYVAGQNGGGAFVLVYLLSILLVGIPIMMAEFLLGREGGKDAIGSFATLAGRKSLWCLVGWAGVIAAFILLSFYAVVAGWCFDYVLKAASGALHHLSDQQISALFNDLLSSPVQMIFWQALFIIATAAIVSCGIKNGIERWSKILMPVLFLLLLYLFIHGVMSSGASRAAQFLFYPDFSLLTPKSLLEAVGHSFFTLSLGAGVMITYGSYLDRQADLFSMAVKVSALDTLVALLAGMAIFPVVFSAGLDPGAGPGLVFQTIPIVFSSAPMGNFLAVVFFLLLAFAALSSSISMLEVSVAWLVDEKQWSRFKSTALLASAAFIVGLPSVWSFNLWSHWTFFGSLTFFDVCDKLVTSYMLPLGGLAVALYSGWFLNRSPEQQYRSLCCRQPVYLVWSLLIRFVAPIGVSFVFFQQLGVF
nr:sodium-dependent transporter [uncultured Desulfuromonas sp.]